MAILRIIPCPNFFLILKAPFKGFQMRYLLSLNYFSTGVKQRKHLLQKACCMKIYVHLCSCQEVVAQDPSRSPKIIYFISKNLTLLYKMAKKLFLKDTVVPLSEALVILYEASSCQGHCRTFKFYCTYLKIFFYLVNCNQLKCKLPKQSLFISKPVSSFLK